MLRSQTSNHAQIDEVYYTVLAGPKPPVLCSARIKGVRHLTGFLKTIILWQFHHVCNTFCHFHSSLIPEFLLPISFHHFHAFFCDLLSTSMLMACMSMGVAHRPGATPWGIWPPPKSGSSEKVALHGPPTHAGMLVSAGLCWVHGAGARPCSEDSVSQRSSPSSSS